MSFARTTSRSARFALAAILTLSSLPATAADPVRGNTLYHSTPGGTSCSNSSCHGSDPSRNQNNVRKGANAPSVIQNAINNGTGAMDIFKGSLSATDVADIAAYIGNPNATTSPSASVSPASLSFPSITVGAASIAQSVTVSNAGSAALSISTITVSGADFARSGGTCTAGGSVAAGSSCTIGIVFSPQSAGAHTGSISISHNATGSPSAVSLSGTAAAPVTQATISTAPASLNFGSVGLGASSAAQAVTVANTGNAALNFTNIAIGGAAAADYTRGGTCAAGTSVAAGSSCNVSVTFAPSAAGTRGASLTLSSNASNGTATVALSGSGAGSAVAGVSPASLNFGASSVGTASPPQNATVSNTGSAPMQLTGLSTTNAAFAITGGTCGAGATIAASGSCTISLHFTPAAAGAASATLSIAHNAGAALSVALSGTGNASATPLAQLSPSSLTFSQVQSVTSTARTLTLANTGTAPLDVSSIALGGTGTADYAIAPASTCAAATTVAAGSSCTIAITFTPSVVGTRNATVSVIHSDAAHSPSTAALNGTGTSAPIGQVAVNQLALSFTSQALGTRSATKSVTVSNSGTAPLALSSFGISGANAGDFAIDPAGTTCSLASAMAPAATCTIAAAFAPTVASGTRSAQIDVAASTSSSATVSLSGSASAPLTAAVNLTPTSVDLGSAVVGLGTASRTVQLRNSGAAPLAISSISASSPVFALTNGCPASLPMAATCTLTVSLIPAAVGAITGTITLVSDAPSSPDRVALAGSGLPTPVAALSWQSGSALSFVDTDVGSAAAALPATLLNGGGASASIQQLQIAGANASDFAIDPATTCGSALAAGASCRVTVGFTPSAAGPRSATLNVITDGAAPGALDLSGNGIATGAPLLTLTPSFITLTSDPNQPIQPEALVIGNDGNAVLRVSAIHATSVVQVLDGTAGAGGTCPPPPFELLPGMACTVMIAALSNGPIDATIDVVSNASTSPTTAKVSGSPVTNAGAGGCSIGPPNRARDPAWALMLAAAIVVLIARRRQSRSSTTRGVR